MLGRVNLPESLVDPSLEILRLVCGSEKEFVRVLVEVLIDIRDDGLGEIHQVRVCINPSGWPVK